MNSLVFTSLLQSWILDPGNSRERILVSELNGVSSDQLSTDCWPEKNKELKQNVQSEPVTYVTAFAEAESAVWK